MSFTNRFLLGILLIQSQSIFAWASDYPEFPKKDTKATAPLSPDEIRSRNPKGISGMLGETEEELILEYGVPDKNIQTSSAKFFEYFSSIGVVDQTKKGLDILSEGISLALGYQKKPNWDKILSEAPVAQRIERFVFKVEDGVITEESYKGPRGRYRYSLTSGNVIAEPAASFIKTGQTNPDNDASKSTNPTPLKPLPIWQERR